MVRFALLALCLVVPVVAAAMPPNEPGQLYALSVSRDGRYAAVSGNSAIVNVFDLARARLLRAIDARQGSVWAAALSPDGRVLATGGGDGTIREWALPSGRPMGMVWRPAAKPSWLTYSPDGRRLVACVSGGIHVVDVRTRKRAVLPMGGDQAQFSPDGRLLVASGGGAYEGEVVVWDVSRRRALHRLKTSWAGSSAISGNQRVASATLSGDLYVWEALSGKLVVSTKGEDANLYSVAISPDGTRLATAGDRGTRLWDATTGKALAEPGCGGGLVAFLPDGKQLAVGTDSAHLCVWNTETGKETKLIGR